MGLKNMGLTAFKTLGFNGKRLFRKGKFQPPLRHQPVAAVDIAIDDILGVSAAEVDAQTKEFLTPLYDHLRTTTGGIIDMCLCLFNDFAN